MKKVFAEIGFGNDTFLSTEVEERDCEHRIRGFILPKKVREVYLRFWIFKKVFILSTLGGFRIKIKNRSKFKILVGVGGDSGMGQEESERIK